MLESTTYPGTSRDVMRPFLERSGHRSGDDFFLAYSSEREDPGNPNYATADIPKVVGGDGPEALRLAVALYDAVSASTVPVSSLEVAEAVKLTENIFRSINIGLVSELKMVYEAMGSDVWECHRSRQNQAVRLHAFLSRTGARRTLHPDRPVLSDVEGAGIRYHDPVHRTRQRG